MGSLAQHAVQSTYGGIHSARPQADNCHSPRLENPVFETTVEMEERRLLAITPLPTWLRVPIRREGKTQTRTTQSHDFTIFGHVQ